MSAGEHLQHKQLAMFMTPKQIQEEYHPHPGDMDVDIDDWSGGSYGSGSGDGMRRLTRDELWEHKAEEAYSNYDYEEGNLVDSVESQGIKRPIPLYHGTHPEVSGDQFVANGQHRVAAAAEVNLERERRGSSKADIEVPVIHHGSEEFGGTHSSLQQATWAAPADRGFGAMGYQPPGASKDWYARPPRT